MDDRFERMSVIGADERDGAALAGLYLCNEFIESFDSHRLFLLRFESADAFFYICIILSNAGYGNRENAI